MNKEIGMLLQKSYIIQMELVYRDKYSFMRKSIYLLTTTSTNHTYTF